MPDGTPELDAYRRRVANVGASAIAGIEAVALAERRLHPPAVPALRSALARPRDRLEEALAALRDGAVPDDPAVVHFHDRFTAAAGLALRALERFVEPGPPATATARILESLRLHREAQAALYPLRAAMPALERLYVEPACASRTLDPARSDDLPVGVLEAAGDPGGRGGFSLYVPEWCDRAIPWPLVVALHGGSGSGRDFLWSWLREARGRGFVLLAPTSLGPTWSLDAPGVDAARLAAMVEYVAERWPVDRSRVLLTGLSDGATFTLLAGLAESAPYTALAPVSGVLHPASFALGNLARARGRRIHLAHGVLDWLFPIALARAAGAALRDAGAELTLHEIEDLSHTYPREENDRILGWFDPGLALPAGA